ncbi:MAG: hypothetical protein WCT14_00895 [Treponemataceae bacterium]
MRVSVKTGIFIVLGILLAMAIAHFAVNRTDIINGIIKMHRG